MHHQQHEPAVYDSAQQESNLCQVLPSDQLCRENPTRPASSPQSILPVWLATNARPDVQSCIRTPTTWECKEVHQVGTKREQAPLQTQFWWAWEGWCPGAHYQLIAWSWPAQHTMLYGYTIYMLVQTRIYTVHTLTDKVCTSRTCVRISRPGRWFILWNCSGELNPIPSPTESSRGGRSEPTPLAPAFYTRMVGSTRTSSACKPLNHK